MRYGLGPTRHRMTTVSDASSCPTCLPRHRKWPLADAPVLRGRAPRDALARCRAAGLAALAALTVFTVQGAWARPALAKPAAVSASMASSAPAAMSAPAVLSASAASTTPGVRFGVYGLSPVQAGQALAQAESALRQPLKVEAAGPKLLKAVTAGATAPDCHYRSTVHQPGVRYTLSGERITRIETRDPRYATVSGVQVGDRLERAQQAYGKRLASAPHPYFDRGRMLSVDSPDRRFALVMETNDAGRITTLRGGRLPEVGWLEGCAHGQAAAPVSLIPVVDAQRRPASEQ